MSTSILDGDASGLIVAVQGGFCAESSFQRGSARLLPKIRQKGCQVSVIRKIIKLEEHIGCDALFERGAPRHGYLAQLQRSLWTQRNSKGPMKEVRQLRSKRPPPPPATEMGPRWPSQGVSRVKTHINYPQCRE